MNLRDAAKAVIENQLQMCVHEDEPDIAHREVIDYARNVLGLPGEGPSNWQIEDDGSDTFKAYETVLKATPEEIDALFAELARPVA